MEYENLSFAIQYDAFVFSFSLGALWDNGGFFLMPSSVLDKKQSTDTDQVIFDC